MPATSNVSSQDQQKFVQTLLADLAYQTQRADSAEKKAAGWREQADDWQALYNKEKERAALLQSAGTDRKDAQAAQNIAVTFLQQQHAEDKAFIETQDARIRKLENSRFKWGLGGLVLGGGVCVAATVPNLFTR